MEQYDEIDENNAAMLSKVQKIVFGTFVLVLVE